MAKKKTFFEKPWAQITSVLIIVLTILGGGYQAGVYQKEIECNLDKNILITEYQSKLRDELNKQKECETVNNNRSNEALNEIINIISKHGIKK